ncbi:hypothetical protein OSV86_06935 [Escherichia marmotae]|uniref:hypothetical protein n=1 Tax=Escherichia marmotae TaxID=1499973 RepID=UPI0023B3253E|nr:hypothetical protein [Escherichia marmotae]MDE9779837.1 hypothetical protein [Escherichia marmotae]
MLDAAKEAGARFKYVDPEAPDMKLPGELELLSKKAIKQGRSSGLEEFPLHSLLMNY